MKFINMYLVGYVVLILGLTLGLWQAGILQALAPVWIAVGLIVAIGMGIMLAVSAGKPPTTTLRRPATTSGPSWCAAPTWKKKPA